MDEGLRERLKRLRRETIGPAPSDARERLRRRAARLGAPCSAPEQGPGSFEEVSTRTTRHPLGKLHGREPLARALGSDPRAFGLLTGDEALAGLDLARAVYLDTETSGLSGGAGTWVFLVGLGRFEGDAFEVWQGFLAEPARERELLSEAAERIRAAPAVVSFFGKAFDRHRLEDKMRLHGIAPPFAGRPHLDLYHPLRRLHRGRFEDTRLKTLERELCGVRREADLPGSLAPAAWFDFLRGRPHDLPGVFRHNLDDVLSLVALAAALARTPEEELTRATKRPRRGRGQGSGARSAPGPSS